MKLKKSQDPGYAAQSKENSRLAEVKRKKTVLKTYGVSNVSKSKKVIKKIRQVFQEKYGVDNCMHVDSIRQKHAEKMTTRDQKEIQRKMRATCLTRFGTESPQGLKEVRDKMKKTCRKLYESSNAMGNPEVRARQLEGIQTAGALGKLSNFGAKNGMNSPGVRQKHLEAIQEVDWDQVEEKRRATQLRKYGADHPMHIPEFKRKQEASMMARFGVPYNVVRPEVQKASATSQFTIKKAKFGGKTFHYQGYEGPLIEMAVKKFGVRNVIGQFEKAFPRPVLKDSHYRPDLFIKSIDTYLEVKGVYTLFTQYQRNRTKARSMGRAGYKMIWAVMSDGKNKVLVNLPKDWFDMTKTSIIKFLQDVGIDVPRHPDLSRGK